MNKNILLVAAFSCFAAFGFAQIKVVAPNGDVGIGTSNPTEKLEIAGRFKAKDGTIETSGESASLMFDRTDMSAFIIGAGNDAGMSWDKDFDFELRSNLRTRIVGNRYIQNGNLRLKILGSNGKVGIGTGAPSTKLHVNGSFTYNGSINNASDKRLKKNVSNFKYGLKEVMQLNPISFEYNEITGASDGKSHVGLYAQDLQKITPELVGTFTVEKEDEFGEVKSRSEYLNIKESAIKYMLVNSIKEQQEVIEKQEDKISDLESRLCSLEDLIKDLSNNKEFNSVELEGDKTMYLRNNPNPFKGITTIEYRFPEGSQDISVQILDMQGKVMKTVKLDSSSLSGEIEVKADSMAAGTYSYLLIANGAVLSTQKMVIAK